MNFWPVEWSRRLGLIVLMAAALLYLLTLDNGLRPDELSGGDLITHQYAQVEARPGNAPGYPLYTMGGWLWFHGPGRVLRGLLNPIEILSLYSTLWSLGALLVLYLILLRVSHLNLPEAPKAPLGEHPGNLNVTLPGVEGVTSGKFERVLVPALLTLFYAVTYFFWYYSVTSEQYTSAVFQTLLIIWLAFRWDDTPRDALLLAMAFVSGTMLANMVTTLFILPPLLWFILSRRGPEGAALFTYLKRPKLAGAAFGLALLPLLSYGYVYIRGAQRPEWRGAGTWPTPWAWFVEFITIRQGRDELAPGLGLQSLFTGEFPWLMGQELTWPIFVGGLLGLAALGRRRAIFLYSTLLIYFFFCWVYRFGNWFQVILPAYPIFIIGVGSGLKSARHGGGGGSGLKSARQGAVSWLIILILGGLLVYRLMVSLPRANQHNLVVDTGLEPGWAILADRPALPAAVVAAFEERVALQYLQTVWQLAPGLVLVEAEGAGPGLPQPETAILYITRRAATVTPALVQNEAGSLQAAGEQLIALHDQPSGQLPASAYPLSLDFGGQLRLIGWEPAPARPAEIPVPAAGRGLASPWQIALYWQAEGEMEIDYTISVRPLAGGQLIMQGGEPAIQDHQPVWGVYPTSRWRDGEIVRDVYTLALPDAVTPDGVQVVVYRATAGGFENLGEQIINLRSRQP